MEPILDDVRELARRADPEFLPAFLRAVAHNFEYGGSGGERDDRYWDWYGPKGLLADAVELLREHHDLVLFGLLEAADRSDYNGSSPEAIYFLGQLGDERAVPALTALVGNWDDLPPSSSSYDGRSPQVVAASALHRIGPTRAARLKTSGEFVELAKELQNPWARRAATRSLSELLSDPAGHYAAVEALGRLFDPHVIGFLVYQVKQIEHEPDDALAAARVLSELSEARVVLPTLLGILRALGRDAPEGLEACIERIGGPEAQRALADHRAHPPEPLSWVDRARVFYSGRPGGVKEGIEAETEAYMKAVAEARAKMKEETFAAHLTDLETSGDFEMLMEALRGDDVRTREAALGVVRRGRDARFVEQLVEMLRDAVAQEDRRGMDKVVRALERIGRPAVAALMDALKDDSATVRWVVAGLLGEIGDADAAPSLEALLVDPDEGVREAASIALDRMGFAQT